MKHPIDCEDTFDKSFLFWLSSFVRYKVTSLSNRHVSDNNELAFLIKDLRETFTDIDELKLIVKKLRNIGINGIHVYFLPLSKLFVHLQTFGARSLKEIDEELLREFLASATSSLADASKKNHKVAIVDFFNYIDKHNSNNNDNSAFRFGIELSNWAGLGGKSGQKLPEYMHKKEVKKFIKAIDKYPFSPKIIYRNRLIIKLILYTGIRVSEALKLSIKDMIREDDYFVFKVLGKGNKPRVAMIKQKIIQSDLDNWLNQRKCNSDILVCNRKGNVMTQAYISRQVENILKSINLRKEKNGAHMLRHTFATMLYQKSKDLILVQESLGHSDINTSRIYTHFDTDKLKKTTNIF
jgi:integrase/recombinase XerD